MIAALIPAAGSSSRMGQPKLLLSFDGQTLIGRLVAALGGGGAAPIVVITPPADAPEGPAIALKARRAGAQVVVPAERPASMRASIELGLQALSRHDAPQSLLLTPGDCPGINAEIVAQLLAYAVKMPERIVIPSYGGRRGHPIVLPWRIAAQIPSLPADLGVNALVAQHGDLVVELEVFRPEIIADLDTPDDLQQWLERQNAGPQSAQNAGSQRPDSGSEIRGPVEPNASSGFRVHVRLFALAKDRAGCSELAIDLKRGATVRDLRAALALQVPALAPLLPTALIAVDEEYAGDDSAVSPGSRLAIIPPVSGGAGGASQSRSGEVPSTDGDCR
jgi:molybdenum cofactor cytidylyltransferase